MTLKSYLWGMRFAAFFSFVALALVVWYVDPEKTGAPGKFLFFASMLLFCSSLFILFFTWLRRHIGTKEEHAIAYLGASLRQGILVALLIVFLLILQEYRVLVWWDGALVAVGILLVELYFLTRE
jgi:hypothetical protein